MVDKIKEINYMVIKSRVAFEKQWSHSVPILETRWTFDEIWTAEQNPC